MAEQEPTTFNGSSMREVETKDESVDTMESADNTVNPVSNCLAYMIGGIWIPFCCEMAAQNVDESKCERPDMVAWLRTNIVVAYVAPVLGESFILIGFFLGIECLMWSGHRIKFLSLIVNIGMFVWCFIAVANSTSDNCAKPESLVDPRTLMLVINIMQVVVCGCCLMCCTCCYAGAGVAFIAVTEKP